MGTKFKSILNVTWKVGLGLVGAGAAVVCAILLVAFFEGRYGRLEWRDRTISGDVVVRAYRNGTVRIWNKAAEKYTTGKVKWVSGEPCGGDSLTVFCDRKGRRGYVNVKTGRISIPARYSKAWNFSEGLAAVLGGDGRVGFIDKDGHMVIGYIIPFEKGEDYIFDGGYCTAMRHVDGVSHYAIYRKDGSLALDWNHTRIDGPNREGYRIVGSTDGFWLVDSTFRKVLPDVYTKVEYAPENKGVFITGNHIKQLVGFDGSVKEPFLVDETRNLELESAESYRYGKAPDMLVYRVDGLEGLMDAVTGKVITPAAYLKIEMVSEELIRAEVGDDSESVILDRKGRVVGRC